MPGEESVRLRRSGRSHPSLFRYHRRIHFLLGRHRIQAAGTTDLSYVHIQQHAASLMRIR